MRQMALVAAVLLGLSAPAEAQMVQGSVEQAVKPSWRTVWDQTGPTGFVGRKWQPTETLVTLEAGPTDWLTAKFKFTADSNMTTPREIIQPGTLEVRPESAVNWQGGSISEREFIIRLNPVPKVAVVRHLGILVGYRDFVLNEHFTVLFNKVPIQENQWQYRYQGWLVGASGRLATGRVSADGQIAWLTHATRTDSQIASLFRTRPTSGATSTQTQGFEADITGRFKIYEWVFVNGGYAFEKLTTPNGNFTIGIRPYPVREWLIGHTATVGIGAHVSF